jgi:hypothetical protein
MEVKLSDRLIQISAGVLLVVLSGLYLWRETLLPILRSKAGIGTVIEAVRVENAPSPWQDKLESARARALEALEADRQKQLNLDAQKKGDPSSIAPAEVEGAAPKP